MTSRDRSEESGPLSKPIPFSGGSVYAWPNDFNSFPYVYEQESKVMTDVVTEGFHSKIDSGEIVNSPCYYESEFTTAADSTVMVHVTSPYSPGTAWDKTGGNWAAACYARFGGPPVWSWTTPTISWPTDPGNDAKQQAIANIDSTPYEFFEDLLEIRETLQLIRHPLESIRNLGRAYKKRADQIRRSKRSTGDIEKALASLWNQYRFALTPLIKTLCGLYEVLEKWSDIRRPVRRGAHGHTTSPPNTETSTFDSYWGGATTVYWWSQRRRSWSAHAAILYEVSNPLENWQFKLGLRSKDIPAVLWDIIPLSFMVDRFLDIEAFIKGLVNLADPNVVILAASVTTKKKEQAWLHNTGMVHSGGQFSCSVDGFDTLTKGNFVYERVIWNPSVGDTFPVFNPRGLVSDVTKMIDLVAIVRSLFK